MTKNSSGGLKEKSLWRKMRKGYEASRKREGGKIGREGGKERVRGGEENK